MALAVTRSSLLQQDRASRAVLPSPFPIATATKWRTREKRPGTSPLVQRTPSAHARSRAPPDTLRGPSR